MSYCNTEFITCSPTLVIDPNGEEGEKLVNKLKLSGLMADIAISCQRRSPLCALVITDRWSSSAI